MIEDGRPAEVYLERPERRSIAGNVYKGTVDNVLPGMEAAFVEIGLEKNGFLYVDEIVTPELEGRGGRKIQDLLKRNQEILVQAVKDPMKSKGARLTTEISLPGRFVVFVPSGEGLGVSRRLEDDERIRLRDILKAIAPKKGGVIVRTAAEGASAEDIERDLTFLQKLWKSIEANAAKSKAPALVYQEAELPLRVTRDLFTDDFEKALVDHDRTYKRIVGYLKKTSPHMVDRVIRYREKTPLFEAEGVEDAIKSTLSRRVDLPSGGYLVFDYAEAFTVIDVNTGRFVGSRSKSSGGRLEDTITANNLEAVKEVVHQLRLRDIGGIIVIDFIDMANPKNRATVEEALKTELERDRTKTYVVEISPLGLVEMTRQNVTDGPREILTQKCPTCGGDGIVISTHSAAIDAERRLRDLAKNAKRGVEAFRVELEQNVASHLIGPGALAADRDRGARQAALLPRRQGGRAGRPLQGQGRGQARGHRAEGSGRGGRRDPARARRGRSARHRGRRRQARRAVDLRRRRLEARRQEGQGAHRARPERRGLRDARPDRGSDRQDGRADHRRVGGREADPRAAQEEGRERRPSRRAHERPVRDSEPVEVVQGNREVPPTDEEMPAVDAEAEEPEAETAASGEEAPKPKKKTRRGSRGGRNRRKKPAAARRRPPRTGQADEAPTPADDPRPVARARPDRPTARNADGEQPPKKKRTRRGSRGGRNRRKKPAAASTEAKTES